jgi:predicted site-specific integrase-resolvase
VKQTEEFYSGDHPLNREWPITSRQLCNYLKVTMRCLHNWRKDGKIPYWRVTARCFRYDLSAVERALAKPDELEE